MDNKIFIIHSSEIIIQGLNSIIKSYFKVESIPLSSVEGLKNYYDIDAARILILIEADLYSSNLQKALNSFQRSILLKVIKIDSTRNKKQHDNDCSLSINAPKSEIINLINQYLQPNSKISQNKNSTVLTGRETDVLKLVALGKTNKEIAEQLFISIHTVISHRKNITEKLGIKSISGLTVYAILNKLIDTTIIDPESLI